MSTASPVIGSLCTGYGGLDMGALTVFGGGRIAWVADPDPHVRMLLAARLPGVPNLGDIREVDWSAVEPVDVVTAGFPCQDISAAGRRAGIRSGARSGLWHHVARAVDSLRPALVVVENVAALRWRGGGIDIVLGDLADAGYDCVWNSVRASDVGAAHRRERVFILAWLRDGSASASQAALDETGLGDTATVAWGEYEAAIRRWEAILGRPAPYPTEPGRHGRPVLSGRFVEFLMGLDDGFVSDLDIPRTVQLRILGNGVVPQQAARAIRALMTDRAASVGRDREEMWAA
jgi:DNA (cytosine-5)-methyltransferase 1